MGEKFIDSYRHIYEEMRERNKRNLLTQGVSIDPLLRSPEKDTRLALGLFAYYEHDVPERFNSLLEDAQATFPQQTLYKPRYEDNPLQGLMHHTFFLFAKTGSMTKLPQQDLERYKEVAAETIKDMKPFTINFNGLIAIPTGILMYGYPSIDLNTYRKRIETSIAAQNLFFNPPHKQDIVHSTLVRLNSPVAPQALLDFAAKYDTQNLTTLEVNTLQLAYGTWRQLPTETEHTYSFDLAK